MKEQLFVTPILNTPAFLALFCWSRWILRVWPVPL